MRIATGVNGSPDLWDPEADAEVREEREGEPELVAVEGAGGLSDHNGVEAACRVPERHE